MDDNTKVTQATPTKSATKVNWLCQHRQERRLRINVRLQLERPLMALQKLQGLGCHHHLRSYGLCPAICVCIFVSTFVFQLGHSHWIQLSTYCSHFVVTRTINKCIRPYGNQTWHSVTYGDCLQNLFLFDVLFSVSPAPMFFDSMDVSPGQLSLPSKSITLAEMSFEALWHECKGTTTLHNLVD